jgi:hypothetical protein
MIELDCYSAEDQLSNVRWPRVADVRPLVGEYITSLDNAHTRQIVRIEHRILKAPSSRHILRLELAK